MIKTIVIVGLLLSAPLARAGDDGGNIDLAAIWKDPTFQKQFIGSYGVNAEIEPRLTPDEVKILDKIRPFMADDLPQAEATLQKLMKPDSSATLDYTLAGIRFQRENLPGSLEAYQRAVAKFPSFRRAWRNLGLIQARNGDFDPAIKSFTHMIELGGGDAYSYGLLGVAYASKLDYQAAETAYRNALLLQPDDREWRLGLTRCVFKQGKFEDAAALLDVLITRYPETPEFWMLQAHTFLGLKQPLKAASNLEAVDLLGKATVDSLDTLGDIYVSENLMDLASRAYQRAMDLDTKQPVARPLRAAEVLASRGAVPQARAVAFHVRQVLHDQLDDTSNHKLFKLEARLTMAEGIGDDETARVLEQIVQADPLDGEALMLLGQHYSRHDQPDRAIFYYERAESIDAFEVNARIRHAQALVGMGRYSDAMPLLHRAQELKPRDDVARYMDQVERIAKSKR